MTNEQKQGATAIVKVIQDAVRDRCRGVTLTQEGFELVMSAVEEVILPCVHGGTRRY